VNRFDTDIARLIWDSRYRYRDERGNAEPSVEATWRRVAHALASVEPAERELWERRFFGLMRDFRFLPGGRILAGAGSGRDVTLFNCFVMGPVADSLDGIFDAIKEGAVTMQRGGGVGYDFSTLRPAGSPARHVGSVASGPVSFMGVWDSMCGALLSTGARRGAMMATLSCDHPDIEAFVDAKRDPGALRNFNLSVLVTDAFLVAVERDAAWPLLFPLSGLGGADRAAGVEVIERVPSGGGDPEPCAVLRRVAARELWQRIMRATYDTAEPGVLFIDRINRLNNLAYRERISATNPCGELPMPPYGACDLGALNLTRFVRHPFTGEAVLEWEALEQAVGVAVRLLDDVIDLSAFPLPAQARQARGSRRIGLGITGLADSLILLGLHYGSEPGRNAAAEIMGRICRAAYRASIALAREKGCFPFFERDAYLAAPFVQRLPEDIRDAIAQQGIRNSHLTTIAPTGTISLFAGNVSSGIEPVFDFQCRRRVRGGDAEYSWHPVRDYALRKWRELHPTGPLPESFVDARALAPAEHLAMQAALQPRVDSAISKTVNVPGDFPFEEFVSLYRDAYRLGLKGCTTFRPNPVTGSVLDGEAACSPDDPDIRCCGLDREGD
jgi:ribonucleoside-diphosphate reductase alpha chain